MDNQEHCGYHNYSTFLVCTWLENDRLLSRAAQVLVSQLVPVTAMPEDEEWGTAAQVIQNWTEKLTGTPQHPLAESLMNSGLAEVDWLEVAVNCLAEDDPRVLRRPPRRADKYTITINLANRALWDGGEISTQLVAGVMHRLGYLWADSDFVQREGPFYDSQGREVARTEYLR